MIDRSNDPLDSVRSADRNRSGGSTIVTRMNACTPPLLVIHRHGAEPFSIGRLVGDLVLRYETPNARAATVARDLEAAFEAARAASGVASVRSEDIRGDIEDLLAGRSTAAVAGRIAERWRRSTVAADASRLALPMGMVSALRLACERFVEARCAGVLADGGVAPPALYLVQQRFRVG